MMTLHVALGLQEVLVLVVVAVVALLDDVLPVGVVDHALVGRVTGRRLHDVIVRRGGAHVIRVQLKESRNTEFLNDIAALYKAMTEYAKY